VNMEAGNQAVLENRLGEAENHFSDAIKLDACDATAYLSRGLVDGLRDKSAAELQDLTQPFSSTRTTPWLISAAACLPPPGRLRQRDQGPGPGDRLRPEFAVAYRYRGDCREKVHDYAAAEKDLTDAIRLDSKDLIARELLATVRLRNGEVKQAAEDFAEVVKLKDAAPRACAGWPRRRKKWRQSGGRIEPFDGGQERCGEEVMVGLALILAFLQAASNDGREDLRRDRLILLAEYADARADRMRIEKTLET